MVRHAWWFPDLTGAADDFDDPIPHRCLPLLDAVLAEDCVEVLNILL